MTSVRTGFATKILRLVSFFCSLVEGRKASKYAAILALSVEDPVEVNRRMAYKHLQVSRFLCLLGALIAEDGR